MSACLCRQTQAVGISPGLLEAGEEGEQILQQFLPCCSGHVPAHMLGWSESHTSAAGWCSHKDAEMEKKPWGVIFTTGPVCPVRNNIGSGRDAHWGRSWLSLPLPSSSPTLQALFEHTQICCYRWMSSQKLLLTFYWTQHRNLWGLFKVSVAFSCRILVWAERIVRSQHSILLPCELLSLGIWNPAGVGAEARTARPPVQMGKADIYVSFVLCSVACLLIALKLSSTKPAC